MLVCPEKIGLKTDFFGQTVEYMSWRQLEEVQRYGIHVGAYEDAQWNINKIPQAQVLRHVRKFKPMIEDRLGTEVNLFGVKEGIPRPVVRQAVIDEGYRAFLTQCPTYGTPDLFAVGRIQVDDEDFNILLTI